MKFPIILTAHALIASAILLSCAREVKPTPQSSSSALPVSVSSAPSLNPDTNRELSAEEEAKIQLVINFDGQWRKSVDAKATIIIKGKHGRVIANNGGEIPIEVRYLSPTRIKIIESNYNARYLENWLPRYVAKELEGSPRLKAYSILDIIDSDTLRGTSYGWQIRYDTLQVQSIDAITNPENWKRIIIPTNSNPLGTPN
jgi:hypothetical protein